MFSHYEAHLKSRLQHIISEYLLDNSMDFATFVDMAKEYNIQQAAEDAYRGEFFGSVGELITLMLMMGEVPVLIN